MDRDTTAAPSQPGREDRPADRTVGERLEVNKKLDLLFRAKTYPDGQTNQARYLRNVREMGRELCQAIVENTPKCADQSAALRCVREAVLWAEEAVMRDGIV